MRTLRKVRIIQFLTIFSFTFLFHSLVWTQEKAESKLPLPSKTFESDFSLVWDSVLETLKKNDFTLAKSDKESGKITTKTKRYFRIFSANFPPVERDYRDTYEIFLSEEENKNTRVEIKRKFEIHDHKKRQWIQGNPQKEKAGLSEDLIFRDIQLQIAGAVN